MEPRLIDANALKEHISSFTGRFTDEGGFEVSMDAVLGAIDYAETVDTISMITLERILEGRKIVEKLERRLLNDRWILCSERMPSESHWYLISFVDCDGVSGVHTSFYSCSRSMWDDLRNDLKVIAWAPFPEPYFDKTTN